MKNSFIVSFVILWALVALCMFDIKNIKEDLSFKQQEIDQAGTMLNDLVIQNREDCMVQREDKIISHDVQSERSMVMVLIKGVVKYVDLDGCYLFDNKPIDGY